MHKTSLLFITNYRSMFYHVLECEFPAVLLDATRSGYPRGDIFENSIDNVTAKNIELTMWQS